jgi:hypothetical protein
LYPRSYSLRTSGLKVPKYVETFPTQIHGWMAARSDLENPEVRKEYSSFEARNTMGMFTTFASLGSTIAGWHCATALNSLFPT